MGQDKVHSVPADPSKWSEKSQQTLSFDFMKVYKDIAYNCWRCKQSAVFSAADQQYTYEVKKALIDPRRILCTECWKELLEIELYVVHADGLRLSPKHDIAAHVRVDGQGAVTSRDVLSNAQVRS
jgi:Probable zinc-ribbon domain